MQFDLLLLTLALPFVLYAGYSDLRSLRIPNWLVISAAVLFLTVAPFFLELDDLLLRLGAGGACLVLGVLGFAVNLFGAGDAKLLAVIAAFLPTEQLATFAFLLGVFLLACVVVVIALRRVPALSRTGWRGLIPGERFPMAAAIAPAYAATLSVL